MIYFENLSQPRPTGTLRDADADFDPKTLSSDVLTLLEADNLLGRIAIFTSGYQFREGPQGEWFNLVQEPSRAGAVNVADILRFSRIADDPANQAEHDSDYDALFSIVQDLWPFGGFTERDAPEGSFALDM